MTNPPASAPDAAALRRKRRRRRWLTLLLLFVTLAACGYPLLTRSVATRLFVMGRIGGLLGGQATASSVTLDPSGRVVIENALLRARGVPGEAGVVVSVRRLEAEFEWSSLFSGSPVIHSVILDQPVARISQSVDNGSVNVAALTPHFGSSSTPPAVPRVIVRSGAIELGEHHTDPRKLAAGAPAYTALKRFDVAGEVDQSLTEQGASVISFRQVDAPGGTVQMPGGLKIEGRVADDGISLLLEGLALSDWSPERIPTPLRDRVRQTAVEGKIERAELTYSYAGTLEARVALEDVALNLPVTRQPAEDDDGNPIPLPPDEPARLMRMERVNGEIVFSNRGVVGRLAGKLEELPYDVDFHIDGTSMDAPFTCHFVTRGFELKAQPDIVGFAPGVARRRLGQFSDPTGIVDADVTVSRGPPVDGRAADVRVSGKLTCRDVTAAFHKFPYRFYHLKGEVTFDDDRVDIVHIEGDAPSGARISATGTIAPPSQSAAVDLDIRVTNLPIDETLAQAMKARRRIIDELFSKPQYEALVAKGLVIPAARAKEASEELDALVAAGKGATPAADELRRQLARPVFDLGGRAEVRVQIQRRYALESSWTDIIEIKIAQAGMLPGRVPYPMIARDISIVRADDVAAIKGGTYTGLTGGTAAISASADFIKLDDPGIPFVPDVSVAAADVPIDAILINAIPEPESTAPEDRGMVPRMLTELAATGTVAVAARIGLTPDNQTGYNVDVVVVGASAAPRPGGAPARLQLSEMAGQINVTQDGLAVEMAAAASHTAPADATTANAAPTRAKVLAKLAFKSRDGGPPLPPDIDIAASAPGCDVSLPVEDLIRIFSPDSADVVQSLRDTHHPAGAADIKTTVLRPSGMPAHVVVDAANLAAFELGAGGGRIGLAASRGSVRIAPSAGDIRGTISFSDFGGDLSFNGSADGHVEAQGVVALDGMPIGDEPFRLFLKDAHLESGAVRAMVEGAAPPKVAAFYKDANPRGAFDLDLTLGMPSEPLRGPLGVVVGDPAAAPPPDAWNITGSFTPRSLALTMNGVEIVFPEVHGRVEFGGGDGRIKGLRLAAPAWVCTGEGSWIAAPGGGAAFQTSLAINAESLTPDLRAALPDALREVLATLSFEAHGPVRLEESGISITFDDAGGIAALRSTGRISVRNASLDVGSLITQADGTIGFTVSRTSPDTPTDSDVWALLDSFLTSGVSMTKGRARVIQTQSQTIVVPHFSADCHGGRIAGHATIQPAAANGARRYEATISASDVRFASVLEDLSGPGPAPESAAPDESRGVMSAGVSLGGIIGDPESRRGRGSLSVGGGRVLNVPLLVPLLRVSNLQLPFDERLDFGIADFYLTGSLINFEELSVSSASVGMYGFGTATWPDMRLDLRFRSKNRNRIPLLTGMLEGIRDELLTAVVRGTLREPDVTVATLTGTTRFLGRVFGSAPSEQQRRLDQIEARVEQDDRRLRRDESQAVPASPPPRN